MFTKGGEGMKFVQLKDKEFSIVDLHKIESFATAVFQENKKTTTITLVMMCGIYKYHYNNSVTCYNDFIRIKSELLTRKAVKDE